MKGVGHGASRSVMRVIWVVLTCLAGRHDAKADGFLWNSSGRRRVQQTRQNPRGGDSSSNTATTANTALSANSNRNTPPFRHAPVGSWFGLGAATTADPAAASTNSSRTAETHGSTTTSTTTWPADNFLPRPRHLIQSNDSVEKNAAEKKKSNSPSSKHNRFPMHTYIDDRGRTWQALNTPMHKFQAFLHYHRLQPSPADIVTTTVTAMGATSSQRQAWRNLWHQGQLLTERTDYFAVYPSDATPSTANTSSFSSSSYQNTASRRGGFSDMLHLYTKRLLSFLQDEQEDVPSDALYKWLRKEYGTTKTQRLTATALQAYPPSEQEAYWKEFLEWFRHEFPYYYDRCAHCGASIREDVANNNVAENAAVPPTPADATNSNNDDENASKAGHKTFLGYVHPIPDEVQGKASRTELYQCHKCYAFTRFPRYNSAWHVIEHARGRCGEYSLLLFRLLRALGHEARWVVDWADHVWVEVFSERAGAWIHLDPCEAAVHENYLYQGWGKQQTYVLGFYAPLQNLSNQASTSCSTHNPPLIEDITASYTTDSWEEIQARRDESSHQVQKALQKSTEYLHQSVYATVE